MPLFARTETAPTASEPGDVERGRIRRSAPTENVVGADRRVRPTSHPRRFLLAGTLSVVVALVLHSPGPRSDVAGQDSVGTPVAIDAAGCTVAPREFEDIAALA